MEPELDWSSGCNQLSVSSADSGRSDEEDSRFQRLPTLDRELKSTDACLCSLFAGTRFLLFLFGFILLPACQNYLWSIHWEIQSRKIRAASSCFITILLVINLILVRELIATFDFFENDQPDVSPVDKATSSGRKK